MKTILITAYAVNPYKGSEDGTGWNITREIAKDFRVILITRKNNIPHLDRYFGEHTDDSALRNISYVGFDMPNWVMWIKKKTGSKSHVVYYYLWQYFVTRFIRMKDFQFDLAHSLNFHSDSHAHFLWKLGKPTVWGPIGHHPPVPKNYLLPIYGWPSFLTDRFFLAGKWALRSLDPFRKKAIRKTQAIFVINSSVKQKGGLNQEKSVILPAIASEPQEQSTHHRVFNKPFTILSAGRFHYMKGFDMVIAAFAEFVKQLPENTPAELILVGKGEEQKRLLEIADRAGITDKIRWIDWVDHNRMQELYHDADVFFFPSHEGAGMVIPEAMSYGLPVLTYNNAGPGELVGNPSLCVEYSHYEQSVHDFANRLLLLCNDHSVYNLYCEHSRRRFAANFTWDHKGQVIKNMYETIFSAQRVA